ncbi:hypothetical protein ACJQWK_11826 [Exserohilum turcicum]|uniref:LYR motif-containing protein Cup1-like N-terminal domain-containing protein n=1 Tax=Exserohilum turcicum (strain 28A) TaxID=671987 RepID=R0IND0_EXST2|nr:uncharacterized protein SETTUDRAFT_151408 [Exserohilum turcica Et28A]EOA86281.1 hypothetical protein SETTUDRAFT_151408 [Exserohilum turcica Et28A]
MRQPLHLLRALLREASYLPDATARAYFRRYIVARFKAYQPQHHATASAAASAVARYRHAAFKRRPPALIHARARPLLRKAHKGLNFLRRANHGELPCLHKVLFFAYGRLGRRKYALLASLLRPDAAMDGDARPKPLQKLYHSTSRYLAFFDAPVPASKTHYTIAISHRFGRLRAVLRSQHQKGLAIHRELKGPAMKTPIHNIWERPMPIKRARNNVRRWYAETMTRLLPPLPNDEWDRVHAMMVGDQPIDLVKRRTRTAVLEPAPAAHAHALALASTVNEAMALDKPSRADRPAGMQRPHAITPKFMRRLYTKLLVLCCKLDYNDQLKQWKVTWGTPNKTIKPSLYHAPVDQDLFAGVDATGRVPKPPKKHALDKSAHVQPRNADGEYMRFPFFAEFLPTTNPLRKELDEWKRKRAAAAAAAGRAHKEKVS